jgi:hypothetical protein
MKRHSGKPSLKGRDFFQSTSPHDYWHVDFAFINGTGMFFFLCTLLDGYSRFVVHWEIRAQMTEADVETIIQRARERFPGSRPRIISDNGTQYVARDFKEFIWIYGITHVRTSAYYPQSNVRLRSVAPFGEIRVHPPRHIAVAGERPPARGGLRAPLQRGTAQKRDWLGDSHGQAGRPRSGDLRRPQSEAGIRARKEAEGPRSDAIGGVTWTGCCRRHAQLLRWNATWAGDRAPWRHDPSAVPGTKTEGRMARCRLVFPFGIGTKAANRHQVIPRPLP